MPAPPWACCPQLDFLKQNRLEFATHQNSKKLQEFWPTIFRDFFILWPDKEAEFESWSEKERKTLLSTAHLSPDQWVAVRKKGIYNWLNNHGLNRGRRASKVQTVKISMPQSASRLSTETHLYSKKYYDSRVKHLVDAEIGDRKIKKTDRLAIVNKHLTECFKNESIEVRNEIKEAREKERQAKEAAKDCDKGIHDAMEELTIDQLLMAQSSLPDVIADFCEAMGKRTGWSFAVLAGGPDAGNDGEIATVGCHTGQDKYGHTFRRAYPQYESHIATPFNQHLHSVYPKSVRDKYKSSKNASSSNNAPSSSSNNASPPDRGVMGPLAQIDLNAKSVPIIKSAEGHGDEKDAASAKAGGGAPETVTKGPVATPIGKENIPPNAVSHVVLLPVQQPNPVSQPNVVLPPVQQPGALEQLSADNPTASIDLHSMNESLADDDEAEKYLPAPYNVVNNSLFSEMEWNMLTNPDAQPQNTSFTTMLNNAIGGYTNPFFQQAQQQIQSMGGLNQYTQPYSMSMSAQFAGAPNYANAYQNHGPGEGSFVYANAYSNGTQGVNAPYPAQTLQDGQLPATMVPLMDVGTSSSSCANDPIQPVLLPTAANAGLLVHPTPPLPPAVPASAANTELAPQVAKEKNQTVAKPKARGVVASAKENMPEETIGARQRKPTKSKEIVPLIVAAANSGDEPEWYKSAHEYLTARLNSKAWSELVDMWVQFETKNGLMEPGTASLRLPAKNRPAQLSKWMNNRRLYEEIPEIQDTAAFRGEWMTWWNGMQPKWRQSATAGSFPLALSSRKAGDDLGSLRKAGPVGLLMVIISLKWWAGDESCGEWLKALVDVKEVLTEFTDNTGGKRKGRGTADGEGSGKRRKTK